MNSTNADANLTAACKKQPARTRAPRPTGRPTKASPAVYRTLADAVATGLTDEQAAALAGVSADSLARWQQSDPAFAELCKKAKAQRLRERLNVIERGRPGWQGVAWILERTMGSQFAPPKVTAALEHSGAVGMVVTRDLANRIAAARAAHAAACEQTVPADDEEAALALPQAPTGEEG